MEHLVGKVGVRAIRLFTGLPSPSANLVNSQMLAVPHRGTHPSHRTSGLGACGPFGSSCARTGETRLA